MLSLTMTIMSRHDNAEEFDPYKKRNISLDTFRSRSMDHTVFHKWLIKQTNRPILSARPIQYRTSDIIIVFTPAPTPCSRSSLLHAHRSMISFRNQTFALPTDSARPIDYSVSDSRVVFTPAPTPCSCSSLSHAHRFMVFFSQPILCPCGSGFCETY